MGGYFLFPTKDTFCYDERTMMTIPETFLSRIFKEAESEYPRECCGMILSLAARPGELTRLISCRNAQDDCRRQDPEKFPSRAEEAYLIDPRQLLTIQKEMRARGEKIAVIYHSHCDGPALFSKQDLNMACPDGRPFDPDVGHMIISVRSGKIAEYRFFLWNEQRKEFAA